jgi:hypothetical protein
MLKSTVLDAPVHAAPEIDPSSGIGAALVLLMMLCILRAKRA